MNKTTLTYSVIKLLKTSVQEEIFKTTKEKNTYYLQGNKDNDYQFLRDKVSQEMVKRL